MAREQLIKARKELGLSQEKAAELLDVSTITLKRWELELCHPYPSQLPKIEKVYNKSIEQLGLASSRKRQKEIPMTDHLARSMDLDLTGRIIKLVWSWTGGQYQDLQSQINQQIRAYQEIPLTRRQALTSVILLPIGLRSTKTSDGQILTTIAAGLAACWYERRGTDLQTARDAADYYIASLLPIVERGTRNQRQAAAELVMQCSILKSTLDRQLKGARPALAQLNQALTYSDIASPEMHILTLRTIAATYHYDHDNRHALAFAEKAAAFKGGNPQLQSFLLSGLSTYQARAGKRQEAISSLNLAKEAFYQQPEMPIWIDHSHMNLFLNEAETFFHLGKFAKAEAAVEQGMKVTSNIVGKARAYFDQVNIGINRDDQPRDMDKVINCWSHGFATATQIKSVLLLDEARRTYNLMRAAWPGEQRIKKMQEQLD